jgi:hypothetical protein
MSESRTRATQPSPGVWVVTGLAAGAGALIYLNAYGLHNMQPVGWDIFGYIWQTRAAGHTALSGLGARPGVPVLASLLGSATPLPTSQELVVLPIVLAVGLALAGGAVVRVGFGLRNWYLPVLVATTLAWPGTGRTLVGYEGSLLLLLLVTAGVGILVHAKGRPAPIAMAGLLLLAAALTHVAIFAAFVAVLGLYVVLSVPAFLRDRRAGVPVLATDAGGAAAGVIGAAAAGAAVLFGALGFRPGDTLHTNTVSFLFGGRTLDEIRRIRPWATVPAAAIGATAAFCRFDDLASEPDEAGGEAWRRDRPARSMARWGVAWLAVAAAGMFLSLRGYAVPGGRFLLFALPLPLLAGLGLATAGWLIAGPRVGLRTFVAVVLIVGILGGLARQGYRFIKYQFVETHVSLANELNVAATYVRGLPSGTPVVVAVNEPGPAGAYSPKLRANVIRSAMPPDAITRTFVFVGRPEDLLAGRPTLVSGGEPWQQAYNAASRAAWQQAEPALRAGGVALVLQKYNPDGYARLLASHPSGRLANGVFVLRGTERRVVAPPRARPLGEASAALWGLWLLAVLGITGWGFASIAIPSARASSLDVVCLAPAIGAGAAVLAGFAVAAAGGDPSGPIGAVVLGLIAIAGVLVRNRSRSNASASQPPSRSSAPPLEDAAPPAIDGILDRT